MQNRIQNVISYSTTILVEYTDRKEYKLQIMLQKRPFERREVTIDTELDLGLKYSRKFLFWEDPSKEVIAHLIEHYLGTEELTPEELKELTADELRVLNMKREQISENYFKAVTLLVVDSDIEGISFDTVEDTKAAFIFDEIPLGFLYSVVTLYLARVMGLSENLKKTQVTPPEVSNSGTQNEKKEE